MKPNVLSYLINIIIQGEPKCYPLRITSYLVHNNFSSCAIIPQSVQFVGQMAEIDILKSPVI